MAIGVRYYSPYAFNVDANGIPYIGGKLYFYLTETSTPLDTYTNVGLTIANANPVVALDDGQWPSIWLTPTQAYKVVLTDANDVEIWTADPVGPAAGGATQSVTGIIGEVRDFAGPSDQIPQQWALCYGQAVSRTTYAAAFSVLGTAWGAGDGSTTFNLPDLRGRLTAGLDNMGGVAASRLTAGASGVPATTLGGTGGGQMAQRDTLSASSAVTDPGHVHEELLPVLGNVASGGAITVAGPPIIASATNTLSAVTGITVATTVTSALTGTTQNVQPTAVLNKIIYLGA